MLTELKSGLHDDKPGAKLIIERDLKFEYKGSITLAGKPDCIMIDGKRVTVFDCKTGKEHASHAVQVMLYQWLLMADPEYSNCIFTGCLVYKDQGRKIVEPPSQETQKTILFFLDLLGGPKKAEKVPGAACRFCQITKEDCPERVESAQPDYEEPF